MPVHDVAVVLGTRPEAIKLLEVIERLGPRARVVHTGQHFDPEMSGAVHGDLDLPAPAVQLEVGGLGRGAQIGRATEALTDHFASDPPSVVVVQGDTNSTLAAALAANATSRPLVHVEAGLRSGDRAMPEEHNRILVDHLADVCAAPTATSVANLLTEGIGADRVHETGNTIVEAVRRLAPDDAARSVVLDELGLAEGGFLLATFHRPENVDDPEVLAPLLDALAALPLPVVLPMHPRTRRRVAALRGGASEGLCVLAPLPPRRFLALLTGAALAVTDSGGIQEEAAVLGTFAVVVRRSTERPEGLGVFSELCTTERLPEVVARRLETPVPANAACPYGDGRASARIVELIEQVASPA
jgi:UDP-N-acetylglucosamine 2-epimerase (non-hydrolysing)